jgi:hypothetical protein
VGTKGSGDFRKPLHRLIFILRSPLERTYLRLDRLFQFSSSRISSVPLEGVKAYVDKLESIFSTPLPSLGPAGIQTFIDVLDNDGYLAEGMSGLLGIYWGAGLLSLVRRAVLEHAVDSRHSECCITACALLRLTSTLCESLKSTRITALASELLVTSCAVNYLSMSTHHRLYDFLSHTPLN